MGGYLVGAMDIKDLAYDIYSNLDKSRRPVFVCVGSDKFVCDSLAPIVAEYLRGKYNISAYVYGGLDYNITANNLTSAMNYIRTQHDKCQVVVIDASLGDVLGQIKVTKECYPALGRVLPMKSLGDFAVVGVVGRKNGDFNLNSTRLKVVIDMAKVIAKAVAMSMSIFV